MDFCEYLFLKIFDQVSTRSWLPFLSCVSRLWFSEFKGKALMKKKSLMCPEQLCTLKGQGYPGESNVVSTVLQGSAQVH